MKLNHENHGQVTVLNLEGELTADDVTPLKKLSEDQLAEHACDFVLDLSRVEFIDSLGLETMLWLQDTAGEHLGQVRLVSPSGNVRDILNATRLNRCFDTHEDVASAIKSLR